MDNRTKILNIAVELFAKRGYDSVGIQEIVNEAEITKPTLYHYFGSKAGLLDAVLKENLNSFVEGLKTAAGYSGDLPFTLEKIVTHFFEFAKENKLFYRMYLGMILASPESHSKTSVDVYELKIYKILEEMFLQASVSHGNMKGRNKRYAATLMGMINTYIVLYLNGHAELNNKTVYDAVHQFSHGIYS